jgi:glycosyltransferase involved in cell wall biosynthesis
MTRGARFDGAPTVSVLVKAYNHAPFVRQTIDSILGQTFQDFEIVVTDDASTDGTLEIPRGFTDPRVRLEALPWNLGISGAMNATISRARGRYLAILNFDDWALPDRPRRQVEFLDANPSVSLVFGLPLPVNEAGERIAAYNDFGDASRLPDFSRRGWLRQFFERGNCLCSPTAMIRREAYAAAGSYDRRLTNPRDLDMWIRMLITGHNIHVLPEELIAFRIRDNNANMSARRPDTLLRSEFGEGKILRHFVTPDPALFDEVFGDGTRGAGVPQSRRLAELASRSSRLVYLKFALDALYETAQDDDDFDRLRMLTGSVDPLGLRIIADPHGDSRKQRDTISGLTETVANRDRRLEEMTREIEVPRRALERVLTSERNDLII